jgi:hypothetical protein
MIEKLYDFKKIVAVLLAHRDNGFDVRSTATQEDVPQHKVVEWVTDFGSEIWEAHPIIVQNPSVAHAAKLARQHEKIRKSAETVTDKALSLIIDRLDNEEVMKKTSLRDLVYTFSTVVPYLMPKFAEDGLSTKIQTNKTFDADYEVFVQEITNKLKKHDNKIGIKKGNSKKSKPSLE